MGGSPKRRVKSLALAIYIISWNLEIRDSNFLSSNFSSSNFLSFFCRNITSSNFLSVHLQSKHHHHILCTLLFWCVLQLAAYQVATLTPPLSSTTIFLLLSVVSVATCCPTSKQCLFRIGWCVFALMDTSNDLHQYFAARIT